MRQTTIDLIQSFAILCIAFACIANALCLPRLKVYGERFSIVYWVRRIKSHFHRNSNGKEE